MEKLIPARIHVLLARESSQALIIRRGPSRRTAVIGWDRRNDTFVVGQWLKGKIYSLRSDISPGGKYWIYFAMSARKGETYTAVACTPYLKAEDFYLKGDAWKGGGLFLSDDEYYLNDGGTIPYKEERKHTKLKVTVNYHDIPNTYGECPDIYFIRLQRDGWQKGVSEKTESFNHIQYFSKSTGNRWMLVKVFHMTLNHPEGKGVYYEEHKWVNNISGEVINLPDWEWADIDHNRILWAEKGVIKSGRIDKKGVTDVLELFDCNTITFENLKAP